MLGCDLSICSGGREMRDNDITRLKNLKIIFLSLNINEKTKRDILVF
jgi:hypothetical protein